MQQKFLLSHDWQRFTGHCQITYKTRNKDNQLITYCLQDNGDNFGGIRLMRCSMDGEPSHEVHPRERISFERPPIEDPLTKKVNDWISKHEETYFEGDF